MLDCSVLQSTLWNSLLEYSVSRFLVLGHLLIRVSVSIIDYQYYQSLLEVCICSSDIFIKTLYYCFILKTLRAVCANVGMYGMLVKFSSVMLTIHLKASTCKVQYKIRNTNITNIRNWPSTSDS